MRRLNIIFILVIHNCLLSLVCIFWCLIRSAWFWRRVWRGSRLGKSNVILLKGTSKWGDASIFLAKWAFKCWCTKLKGHFSLVSLKKGLNCIYLLDLILHYLQYFLRWTWLWWNWTGKHAVMRTSWCGGNIRRGIIDWLCDLVFGTMRKLFLSLIGYFWDDTVLGLILSPFVHCFDCFVSRTAFSYKVGTLDNIMRGWSIALVITVWDLCDLWGC